jgi:two-component system chemotaxis response regulator CheY
MARILVVDDSETVRAQLKKDLASKGHEVTEAADGELGLQAYDKSGGVDLIICDVNMPKMDGLTMCSKLATKGNKAPIFMLTTEGSETMKTQAKSFGVRAWIIKPYVAEKLLMAVEKVVGK